MITDIWKKLDDKKCSPNQYLHVRICCMCSYVCICMYACVWVYVNVYVCAHMCKHMFVYNTIYAYVSVVSLSETNIVLHYDRYSVVPLWHGQFLSKSWQETNHYLLVRARCGVSFVSLTDVFLPLPIWWLIWYHVILDQVIMALHCSIISQNFALLPCFFAPCFDNYSLWNRD